MEVLKVTWSIFKDFCELEKYNLAYYFHGDFIVVVSYIISEAGRIIYFKAWIFDDSLNLEYQDFMANYKEDSIHVRSLDEAMLYMQMLSDKDLPYNKVLIQADVQIDNNPYYLNLNFDGEIDLSFYDSFWAEIYLIRNYVDALLATSLQELDTEVYGFDDYNKYDALDSFAPNFKIMGEKHIVTLPIGKTTYTITDLADSIEELINFTLAARFSLIKGNNISSKPSNWFMGIYEFVE